MILDRECRFCGGAGNWVEYYSKNDEAGVSKTCFACGGKGYIEPEDDWWEPADPQWQDPSAL
jgi:hypothetical protein